MFKAKILEVTMKNKIISIFVILITVLSLLTSCSYQSSSNKYFDTFSSVSGYENNKFAFDAMSSKIFAMLEEYHRLFDIYNEYEGINNLCTVNKLFDGEHREVKVDRKIIDMLLFSKEMYNLTEGRVNIAMGSVLSIWHDYRTEGLRIGGVAKLPPMDKLTEASEHTDINDLIIDEENSTVYLRDPKMTLDVGAIAKGYAVEMIAKTLEAEGVTGYAINVGGNVRVIGPKDDGKPWNTAVENPDVNNYEKPYIAYLEITNEAVVTSGSYQRYYIVDGVKYHHIIDKNTLMPSKGLLSVTVICKSSAMADALSTALFCMTVEEGQSLVNSLENVEALWVDEDGELYYSDNFDNYKSNR